ncbi:hypothetical protein [Actinomadura logoneensis]|uniref:hypothetical protein n=1 Tax=Actinomadura logoneensis TaxID=2293572 RepID=UPI0011C1278B|nr:hypothetical protein [Actinomadura logoneensis]
MSDRKDCPACSGATEQRLGPLRLACFFCRGEGRLGEDDGAGEGYGPVVRRAGTPVWDQLGADMMPGCRACLGVGRVISLGGDVRGGRPAIMTEGPCPVCADR